MTINLTELRDEPLGKHPNQAYVCLGTCFVALTEAQQDVVAADDESSFTFDVEGLGDEPLDDSPSVECFVPSVCLPGSGFCYVDKDMDTPTADTRMVCTLTGIGTSDA